MKMLMTKISSILWGLRRKRVKAKGYTIWQYIIKYKNELKIKENSHHISFLLIVVLVLKFLNDYKFIIDIWMLSEIEWMLFEIEWVLSGFNELHCNN